MGSSSEVVRRESRVLLPSRCSPDHIVCERRSLVLVFTHPTLKDTNVRVDNIM